MHISELAQHHVENPREVVSQGDVVNVKIIEVDAERRRLSLSLKRVEDGERRSRAPRAREAARRPQIDLSEEVFAERRPSPTRSRSRRGAGRGRDGARGRAATSPTPRPQPRPRRAEPEPRPRSPRREPEPDARREPEPSRGRRRAELPPRSPSRADGQAEAPPTSPSSVAARSPSPSPAASAPGKSEALRAFARHGAADDLERRDRPPAAARATRCGALARALRRRVLRRRRGRPRRDRRDRLRRPRGARLARGAAAPAGRARVHELARAPRRARRAAGRVRDRGAAALRGRRARTASTRSSSITAPPEARGGAHAGRAPTSASRACSPTRRRWRQADFAYVNDGTLEELDAFVAGVLRELLALRTAARRWSSWRVALGGAFAYVHSTEPAWYVRLRYPLRYQAIVRGHARNYGLDPALLAGGHLPGEQVPRGRALELGRDRPDAAAARHGEGDRRPHRRLAASASPTSTTPRSTSATAPGTCATCSTSTATRRPRSRRTTPASRTSTPGGGRAGGSPSPRRAHYVERVEHLKTLYRRGYGISSIRQGDA